VEKNITIKVLKITNNVLPWLSLHGELYIKNTQIIFMKDLLENIVAFAYLNLLY
jgi:hypothetical protein